jgi:hypothetical protein
MRGAMKMQALGEMARWPAVVLSASAGVGLVLGAVGFESKASHAADLEVFRGEHEALVAMVQDTKFELRRISEQNRRIFCKLTEIQTGKIDPYCAE